MAARLLPWLLLAGLLPTGLGAGDPPPGPAGPGKLLEQAADLEKQRTALEKQLQALAPRLEKQMTGLLPRLDGKLAGFIWGTLRYGYGSFSVDLLARGNPPRRVLSLLLVDRRYQPARWKANYSPQKRHGYPAKEVKDRWLWLLVGNFKVRANADPQQPEFQSAEALETLLRQFDLKTLAGL